jgi:predicted PurR-regulated permease PerM
VLKSAKNTAESKTDLGVFDYLKLIAHYPSLELKRSLPVYFVLNHSRSHSSASRTPFLPVLIAIACLYFGRSILIPLALAVVFAFLFGPLVVRLRHLGIHRVPATFGVVILSFGLMTVIGTLMSSQISDVVHKLPQYQENVRTKLHSIRSSGGGIITRFTHTIDTLAEDVSLPPAQPRPTTVGEKPVPVEIRKSSFAPLEMAQKILGSLFSILLTMAVVVVFVIFMLIQREDLRDRFLRLAGEGRVQLTTEAMDDAAAWVATYWHNWL